METDFTAPPYPIDPIPEQKSATGRLIGFCLNNRLVVLLLLLFVILWGMRVNPFQWDILGIPRDPVPVDAIPDIGERQQIVFTDWPGRSPQDVEDQVTYPLVSTLLGVPGVKAVRATSMFGFSSIYVIFDDSIDYYWGRTRVLERLSSLPEGTLPRDVTPSLGPDATALGQIYWYTLEGRSPDGRPVGGWDLEELRSLQDWNIRYQLLSTPGVSEVAGVGGYRREYQVDVDPELMRIYNLSLDDVYTALASSNIDVGAGRIEINRIEYYIRGVGFLKTVSEIEDSVITTVNNTPIRIRNVATVALGPADRTGALDKGGAEAVGGVVVARYGANPLQVINDVTARVRELAPSLPSKVVFDYSKASKSDIEDYGRLHGFASFEGDAPNHAAWLSRLRASPPSEWPQWANISQVTIVPFYDRTGLIRETLGTLRDALRQEIIITMIVILIMAMNLRNSVLISSMMPLAVLLCFIAMRYFGVDANIVALSGIAIAIGTIVDMGIVITENITRHLREAPPHLPRLEVVHRAASEVGSAVLTATSTTVVGFLPVFFMTGPEGKLFLPLAFTKTFALTSSIVIALTIIPAAAYVAFCTRPAGKRTARLAFSLLLALGIAAAVYGYFWSGLILAAVALYQLSRQWLPSWVTRVSRYAVNLAVLAAVTIMLSDDWLPLGAQSGRTKNLIFVSVAIVVLMSIYLVMVFFYRHILGWCLRHKLLFLSVPALITLLGLLSWLGWQRTAGWIPAAASRVGISPDTVRSTNIFVRGDRAFPGLGKEFMPPLDEGSFLYMPTTMPHASIGEAIDLIAAQDKGIEAIPEIVSVVGKIGRVDSALDPAPISMVETIINYKSEYMTDEWGVRLKFKYDASSSQFIRDPAGRLIEDPRGLPFRQWRDSIKSPDDIWREVLRAAQLPGVTSSPKLQPIITRIIMLQTGMRAQMGVKVYGSSLPSIEQAGLAIEAALKEVPSVDPSTVIADRIVGKPYLEIIPDRSALERYNIKIEDFNSFIEMAFGGERATTTVEGRQRFPVRVRYQRELRDNIEAMRRAFVPSMDGAQIPLEQLAEIRYVRGPEMIKSENTFLVGYVLFDKQPDKAEVDVVEECKAHLDAKLRSGALVLPPGVTYLFAGNYENQLHAAKTLAVILPLAFFVIFILIYFQFRSVVVTSLVFTGMFIVAAGGFLMLWLYGQPWFMNFDVFGLNLRSLFNMHTINLSIAVWVGFLALFGIATDDGVIMATYLEQLFRDHLPATKQGIRELVITAGLKRIRPCMMTIATTVLALLPVLNATGRGSDIVVPMAIPSFGGMTVAVITTLVVPVLYCWLKEMKLKFRGSSAA